MLSGVLDGPYGGPYGDPYGGGVRRGWCGNRESNPG